MGSEVVTCDAAGNPRQWFGPGETVYVKGTWFEPNTPYWMWIQDDPVLEGDALVSGEDPSGLAGEGDHRFCRREFRPGGDMDHTF